MKVYAIHCLERDNGNKCNNIEVETVFDNEAAAKEYCDKKNIRNCEDETFTNNLTYFYKEFVLNKVEETNKYKITMEEYDLFDSLDVTIVYSCCNEVNPINNISLDPFGYFIINLYADENIIHFINKDNLKNIMEEVIKKRKEGNTLEELNEYITSVKII